MAELQELDVALSEDSSTHSLEQVKTILRGKVKAACDSPYDLTSPTTRTRKRIANSSKFGLLFQLKEGLVVVQKWRDEKSGFEDCIDDIEPILLVGAMDAKIKDIIREPSYFAALRSTSREPLIGVALSPSEEQLCAWSKSSIHFFSLDCLNSPEKDYSQKWEKSGFRQIQDVTFNAYENEVVIAETKALVSIRIVKPSESSRAEFDFNPLCAETCPQEDRSVIAIGCSDGVIRLLDGVKDRFGTVICSIRLKPDDDEFENVEVDSISWIGKYNLVAGYRNEFREMGNPTVGILPHVAFCHFSDDLLKCIQARIWCDPLQFNSLDKPWEHRFVFCYLEYLNAVIAVSTFSENMAIFVSPKGVFDWELATFLNLSDETVNFTGICSNSMWTIGECPWTWAEEGEEDCPTLVFQSKSFILGACLSMCASSPVQPVHIFGKDGELESKPHFVPPPVLVVLSSDGILLSIALADKTFELGGGAIPGMITTVSRVATIKHLSIDQSFAPKSSPEQMNFSPQKHDGLKKQPKIASLEVPMLSKSPGPVTFQGERLGYVFTLRENKLGYHADVPMPVTFVPPVVPQRPDIPKSTARAILVDFYKRVKPENLKNVDKIVDKFAGKFNSLFDKLESQYTETIDRSGNAALASSDSSLPLKSAMVEIEKHSVPTGTSAEEGFKDERSTIPKSSADGVNPNLPLQEGTLATKIPSLFTSSYSFAQTKSPNDIPSPLKSSGISIRSEENQLQSNTTYPSFSSFSMSLGVGNDRTTLAYSTANKKRFEHENSSLGSAIGEKDEAGLQPESNRRVSSLQAAGQTSSTGSGNSIPKVINPFGGFGSTQNGLDLTQLEIEPENGIDTGESTPRQLEELSKSMSTLVDRLDGAVRRLAESDKAGERQRKLSQRQTEMINLDPFISGQHIVANQQLRKKLPGIETRRGTAETEAALVFEAIQLTFEQVEVEFSNRYERMKDWAVEDRDLASRISKLSTEGLLAMLNKLDHDNEGLQKSLATAISEEREELNTLRRNMINQEDHIRSLIRKVRILRKRHSWSNASYGGDEWGPESLSDSLTEFMEDPLEDEELANIASELQHTLENLLSQFDMCKQVSVAKLKTAENVTEEEVVQSTLLNYRHATQCFSRIKELAAHLEILRGLYHGHREQSKENSSSTLAVSEKEQSSTFQCELEVLRDLDSTLRESLAKGVVSRDQNGRELTTSRPLLAGQSSANRRTSSWRKEILSESANLALKEEARQAESSALAFLEKMADTKKTSLSTSAEHTLRNMSKLPTLKTIVEPVRSQVHPTNLVSEKSVRETTLETGLGEFKVDDTKKLQIDSRQSRLGVESTPDQAKVNSTGEKSSSAPLFQVSSSSSGLGFHLSPNPSTLSDSTKENTKQAIPEKEQVASPSKMPSAITSTFDNPHSTDEPELAGVDIRQTLIKFYELHNPGSLSNIDAPLDKYKGNYKKMIALLEKKYNAPVKLVKVSEVTSGEAKGSLNFGGLSSSSDSLSFGGQGFNGMSTSKESQSAAASGNVGFAGFGSSGFGSTNLGQGSNQNLAFGQTSSGSQESMFGNASQSKSGISGFGSSSSTDKNDANQARLLLTGFYQRFNPEKVNQVDEAIAKFTGRYDKMFELLEKKYNMPNYFSNQVQQTSTSNSAGFGTIGFAPITTSFGSPQPGQAGFGSSGFGSTSFGSFSTSSSLVSQPPGFGSSGFGGSGFASGSQQQQSQGFGASSASANQPGFGSVSSAQGFGGFSGFGGGGGNGSSGFSNSSGFPSSNNSAQSGFGAFGSANSAGGSNFGSNPSFGSSSFAGPSFTQMRQ